MKYLLDSDTITAVFDPKSPFFEITKKHLAQLTELDEIYISILSIYELEFSLYNAKTDIVKNKIKNLIADLKCIFNILPLSPEAVEFIHQNHQNNQKYKIVFLIYSMAQEF